MEELSQRPPEGLELLSNREREVLERLWEGDEHAKIAAGLFISQRTVEFHVAHIYEKLGLASLRGGARQRKLVEIGIAWKEYLRQSGATEVAAQPDLQTPQQSVLNAVSEDDEAGGSEGVSDAHQSGARYFAGQKPRVSRVSHRAPLWIVGMRIVGGFVELLVRLTLVLAAIGLLVFFGATVIEMNPAAREELKHWYVEGKELVNNWGLGPLPVPTSLPVARGDKASFVSERWPLNGQVVEPGEKVEKHWTVRNNGSNTWTMGRYRAIRVSGDFGPTFIDLSKDVAPGGELEISTVLTVPTLFGNQWVTYRMDGPQGPFGEVFWAQVFVSSPLDASSPSPSRGIDSHADLTGQVASEIPGRVIIKGANIRSTVDRNAKPQDVYAIYLYRQDESRIVISPESSYTLGLHLDIFSHSDSTSDPSIRFYSTRRVCKQSIGSCSISFRPDVSGFYYLTISTDDTGAAYTLIVK